MSSAVSVTPLGWMFLASMKARTALTTAALKPFSCVPPERVGMPLAYERHVVVGRLGPLQDRLEPDAVLLGHGRTAWGGVGALPRSATSLGR